MSREDDLSSWIGRTDPWTAAITPERVRQALTNFKLPLADDWSAERLTTAIQDVAGIARGQTPQSNASAKNELNKLAAKARALHGGMRRLGDTAETAAFFELLRHSEEERGVSQIDYDDDFKPTMFAPLELISKILARAASQLDTERPQPPRWPERQAQERRIAFAIALMPIFEAAYETPARANNWGAEYGDEHPWPDFYRRIYTELFPDAGGLNLSEVLQQARRERPRIEAFKQWLGEGATQIEDI